MPLYESTFIARHDMSAQQVEGLAETFSTIIKDNGGEVSKTEMWGLKSLAYRIKKNRKGHFVFFNIDAPPSALQEYERNLRLNEDILRYLTVRVDELDPEPSVMMQVRASRDDRSRRGGGRPRDDERESQSAKSEGGSTPTSAETKTAEDKPTETKSTEDKPTETKSTETTTAEDKPTETKSTEDKPTAPSPAADAPATDATDSGDDT